MTYSIIPLPRRSGRHTGHKRLALLRWDLRALDWVLVTPRFHHWHHAAHPEAVNRNFAVHAPWIDRLFGTAHLPDGRWPEVYGIAGDPVPEGYWRQLVWPIW